jgi:hypothetical protein
MPGIFAQTKATAQPRLLLIFRGEQMNSKREIDWTGVGWFVMLILVPCLIVMGSAWHLWPHMRFMTTGLLLLTLGIAALVYAATCEPDAWLKQIGIAIGFALTIVHAGDLILHVAYSREIDAAMASHNERVVEDARQLEIEKQRNQMRIDATKAEQARMETARKALVQVPVYLKGEASSKLLLSVPSTQPQSLPSATPTLLPGETPPVIETAEQIRSRYQTYMWWALILGVLVALGGGAVVHHARQLDRDGNGIPDWVQRVAKRYAESEFAKGWPKYYEMYGPALQFAPGK